MNIMDFLAGISPEAVGEKGATRKPALHPAGQRPGIGIEPIFVQI